MYSSNKSQLLYGGPQNNFDTSLHLSSLQPMRPESEDKQIGGKSILSPLIHIRDENSQEAADAWQWDGEDEAQDAVSPEQHMQGTLAPQYQYAPPQLPKELQRQILKHVAQARVPVQQQDLSISPLPSLQITPNNSQDHRMQMNLQFSIASIENDGQTFYNDRRDPLLPATLNSSRISQYQQLQVVQESAKESILQASSLKKALSGVVASNVSRDFELPGIASDDALPEELLEAEEINATTHKVEKLNSEEQEKLNGEPLIVVPLVMLITQQQKIAVQNQDQVLEHLKLIVPEEETVLQLAHERIIQLFDGYEQCKTRIEGISFEMQDFCANVNAKAIEQKVVQAQPLLDKIQEVLKVLVDFIDDCDNMELQFLPNHAQVEDFNERYERLTSSNLLTETEKLQQQVLAQKNLLTELFDTRQNTQSMGKTVAGQRASVQQQQQLQTGETLTQHAQQVLADIKTIAFIFVERLQECRQAIDTSKDALSSGLEKLQGELTTVEEISQFRQQKLARWLTKAIATEQRLLNGLALPYEANATPNDAILQKAERSCQKMLRDKITRATQQFDSVQTQYLTHVLAEELDIQKKILEQQLRVQWNKNNVLISELLALRQFDYRIAELLQSARSCMGKAIPNTDLSKLKQLYAQLEAISFEFIGMQEHFALQHLPKEYWTENYPQIVQSFVKNALEQNFESVQAAKDAIAKQFDSYEEDNQEDRKLVQQTIDVCDRARNALLHSLQTNSLQQHHTDLVKQATNSVSHVKSCKLSISKQLRNRLSAAHEALLSTREQLTLTALDAHLQECLQAARVIHYLDTLQLPNQQQQSYQDYSYNSQQYNQSQLLQNTSTSDQALQEDIWHLNSVQEQQLASFMHTQKGVELYQRTNTFLAIMSPLNDNFRLLQAQFKKDSFELQQMEGALHDLRLCFDEVLQRHNDLFQSQAQNLTAALKRYTERMRDSLLQLQATLNKENAHKELVRRLSDNERHLQWEQIHISQSNQKIPHTKTDLLAAARSHAQHRQHIFSAWNKDP